MKTTLVIITLLIATAVLMGCAQQAAPQTAQQPTPATPVAPAAQIAPAPAAPAATGNAAVSIKGFRFTPETLTVKAGTTVTWTNEDSVTHTIKGDGFVSNDLPPGASFTHTFDATGSFDYVCGIHASMRGTILVE